MGVFTSAGRGLRTGTIGLAVLPLVFVLGACDQLLDVEVPSSVDAEFLQQPENAQLLVTSAITDFECAFANYILAGALIGNEMGGSGGFAIDEQFDRRAFDESGVPYATSPCGELQHISVYMALSSARALADMAVRVLSDATDAQVEYPAQLLATARAYAGYTRLLLGESMCSAAIDAGPELSSQQLFALAEEQFTETLNGSPTADIENMALVGRARARLNQGDTAGSLADAQLVPAGFVKYAQYSAASERCSNKVYLWSSLWEKTTVESPFRDLQWNGVPDPRVPVTDMGKDLVFSPGFPFWRQEKYTSREAPIAIARYEEARLIIAEIELGQAAVDIINELHAAAGLPPYDPNTDGPIPDQVILERERELFLESHHLYDVRRFSKPLVPPPGTPYPDGGFYGSAVCLPLPLVERNGNPNIP